jgi:hypothetical protein
MAMVLRASMMEEWLLPFDVRGNDRIFSVLKNAFHSDRLLLF